MAEQVERVLGAPNGRHNKLELELELELKSKLQLMYNLV
jgi:hypothetical protein